MTAFDIEDQWFTKLITYLRNELPSMPWITDQYPLEHVPCLYVEKSEGVVSFDRLSLQITLHFIVDAQRASEENMWLTKIRSLMAKPVDIAGGISFFKEIKQARKSDKKMREITLVYQALAQIQWD